MEVKDFLTWDLLIDFCSELKDLIQSLVNSNRINLAEKIGKTFLFFEAQSIGKIYVNHISRPSASKFH